MRCTSRRTVRAPRAGFTLIEMMAVILIIGVLAALILPAVMSGRRAAQIGAVSGEIRQLEAAIAQFRNTYGTEPPSSVILYEAGGTWDTISMAKIRRLWPNFDFTINRDIDGDGATFSTIHLFGPECLVFFLGGMPTKSGATLTVTGFSKNPANPLYVNTIENRDGPFYEFKPSRLRVSSNPITNTRATASNFFLVYLDSLPSQTMPYVYASSYEGQGYSTVELNVGGTQVLANGVYQVGNTGQPQKPKSFQIISPGLDNQYGVGGPYDPNQPNGGLGTNINDYDNITNFSTGQLVSTK